jgi:hypothetical protein
LKGSSRGLSNSHAQVQTPTGSKIARIPFSAFKARLEIERNSFELNSSFTLKSTASIAPLTEPVTLSVGTFTTTIPPGSFEGNKKGFFSFDGTINGVRLEALIKPTGTLRNDFKAEAEGANLAGTKNPVPVTLTLRTS